MTAQSRRECWRAASARSSRLGPEKLTRIRHGLERVQVRSALSQLELKADRSQLAALVPLPRSRVMKDTELEKL